MIEVNLIPGGKKRVGKRRRGFAFPKLGGFSQNRWVLGAVGAAAAAVGLSGWLYLSIGSQREELEILLQEVLADSARYSEQMTRTNALLASRDSIVARVAVIQEIDQGRYVWPHVLDEVSRALPDYIWVLAIQQLTGGPQPRLRIEGQAGSIEALTVFMDQLESSPFLSGVQTIGTTQTIRDNQLIWRYDLEVDYEQPPIELLETVPLLPGNPSVEAMTALNPGSDGEDEK